MAANHNQAEKAAKELADEFGWNSFNAEKLVELHTRVRKLNKSLYEDLQQLNKIRLLFLQISEELKKMPDVDQVEHTMSSLEDLVNDITMLVAEDLTAYLEKEVFPENETWKKLHHSQVLFTQDVLLNVLIGDVILSRVQTIPIRDVQIVLENLK